MAKVLFINPSKMGVGYTPIWAASHSGLLKKDGHQVRLFDALFYEQWSDNYTAKNTATEMYKPSGYESRLVMKKTDIFVDLQKCIDEFDPDIIFWSAISSHIHSEGEYVCIQYGHDLLQRVSTRAVLIAGGVQSTADPGLMLTLFPKISYVIRGESDLVLREIASRVEKRLPFEDLQGLAFRKNGSAVINPPQPIIADLDMLELYDYSIFEDQVFCRPYNGKIVRAIDYEMARGCPFTCHYCVETVIQKYYGFSEGEGGTIVNSQKYLRRKSSERIFAELKKIYEDQKITFFRCQDTNFLSIPQKTMADLAAKIKEAELPIFFYIETRPEFINPTTVKLLKEMRVDGVGMGIETVSEDFRKSELHRFCKPDVIIQAFHLLKEAGIKRTTYNVLGFCGQTEEMILDTIRFNQKLAPDNISTSFYSPYIGTQAQKKAVEEGYFASYEYNLNDGLVSATKSLAVPREKLEFYRRHFTKLVRSGLEQLPLLKSQEGVE